MTLSADQLQRYSRQLLLPQIGETGQARLLAARVLIVGAGGLGSPAALYLAAAGVGTLVLADDDRVELSNLQRQILYTSRDVGGFKAERGAERLFALNPTIEVEPLIGRLQGAALTQAVAAADLVLDCSDNLTTRHALSQACFNARKLLVSAAAIRWEGQLYLFDYRHGQGPCYHCLYPPAAEPPLNCSTAGVVGPLLGVMGAQQALLALRLLLCQAQAPALWLFDGLHQQWQTLALAQAPDCPVCQR